MTKYNHAYHVAFEVITENKDSEHNSDDQILAGLAKRVAYLIAHKQEVAEACEQYDVYEVLKLGETCEKTDL